MATTIYQQSLQANYTERIHKTSLITLFMEWCKEQQPDRLMWLGFAISAHGCVLTPLTIMAVFTAGGNLVMFMMALVAMTMVLVTNLAALPTKITIPVFILSFMVDLVIVIACVYLGFHPGGAF